jgi:hypothetical protein
MRKTPGPGVLAPDPLLSPIIAYFGIQAAKIAIFTLFPIPIEFAK